MNTIIISVLVFGVTGLIFSIILAFLSKKLQVEEDPRTIKVMEILPGLNCGACGFSGCRAYAEATVRECSLFNGCLPGGKEINEKIDEILGIVGCICDDTRSLVCFCGATEAEKKVSTEYFGPMSCRAAELTNGALDCSYGCFGFGDCATVCPVGAITMVDKKVEKKGLMLNY